LGKSGTARMSCLSGSQLMGVDMLCFKTPCGLSLPGSLDLESGEGFGFAFGKRVFDNGVDAAAA